MMIETMMKGDKEQEKNTCHKMQWLYAGMLEMLGAMMMGMS